MKMKILPTPGYVLVEPEKAKEKTEGGIYLPQTTTNEMQRGTVIAVGKPTDPIYSHKNFDAGSGGAILLGYKNECPVGVGDKVIYKKWGSNEVKIEGNNYLFAKFEDLLAVINE